MNSEAPSDGSAELSPLARYRDYLSRGELAFQTTPGGTAVFFPRVLAPGTGDVGLTWRTSTGLGAVYATTVVHARDEPPRNVALIDMDDGFRLMSRVVGLDPDQVRIGLRVKARVHRDDDGLLYPVFEALSSERAT